MARLAIVLTTLLALAAPAEARQEDPRLDPLFDALLATTDFEQARAIEARIWGIWIEAGDAALDEMMTSGIAALNARYLTSAVSIFSSLIESAPDFAEAWNKRATVYYLMERYEDSIRDVERTLALEPRHFGALSGMGLISTELGDEAAALEWFERALAVNPHMPFIELRVDKLREKLKGAPI